MKMKKLLLSIGTIAAVATPVAAVVACGVDNSKVNYVFNQDKTAFKTLVKDGALNPDAELVAIDYRKVKGTEGVTDAEFNQYTITSTTTNDHGKTDGKAVLEFTKGSAVKLIKSVVQYLNDMEVNSATKFKITIPAVKVVITKADPANKTAKDITAKPTETTATLSIDLAGSFKTELITEQLVNIAASDKSTPKDMIKAEKFVIN